MAGIIFIHTPLGSKDGKDKKNSQNLADASNMLDR